MTGSGGVPGCRVQRRVAAFDDVHVDLAAALQRVLDETRDVRLVFDDENLRPALISEGTTAPH